MIDQRLSPVDYEALVVGSTVVTLTASKVSTATHVTIRVESGSIRYFVHGGTPTTTSGKVANEFDQFDLNQRAAGKFKAIALSGTPTLHVDYVRLA